MKNRFKIPLLFLPILLMLLLSSCGNGSDADIEYDALGASDTTGIGATPLSNGWVFRVKEELENNGKDTELENLGIPGAEISQLNNAERPLAELDNPDLITVFTGVNDLIDGDDPGQFEEDLGVLLGGLRSDTKAVVVVANLPDLTRLPRFVDDPDSDVTSARVAAYNAAIARQAAATGCHLVDLFSIPVGDSLTTDADGFHPNDEGHRIIAEEFLKVIKPLFLQPAPDTTPLPEAIPVG